MYEQNNFLLLNMVKEVSLSIRDLIIQKWKEDENDKLSQRKISILYQVPKLTVNSIIQKYKKIKKIRESS